MALFRRRLRPFRKYQPPSSWPEPTVEETVDEALLIALVAVRLALKNLIIVRALQLRADYSWERLMEATREEFLNLAAEKEADAARGDTTRSTAQGKRGKATMHSDYRSADIPTLQRKSDVLRLLASRLRALADDEQTAADLVARARDEALDEVLSAFVASQPQSGRTKAIDDGERERRMAMVALDLAELSPEY